MLKTRIAEKCYCNVFEEPFPCSKYDKSYLNKKLPQLPIENTHWG